MSRKTKSQATQNNGNAKVAPKRNSRKKKEETVDVAVAEVEQEDVTPVAEEVSDEVIVLDSAPEEDSDELVINESDTGDVDVEIDSSFEEFHEEISESVFFEKEAKEINKRIRKDKTMSAEEKTLLKDLVAENTVDTSTATLESNMDTAEKYLGDGVVINEDFFPFEINRDEQTIRAGNLTEVEALARYLAICVGPDMLIRMMHVALGFCETPYLASKKNAGESVLPVDEMWQKYITESEVEKLWDIHDFLRMLGLIEQPEMVVQVDAEVGDIIVTKDLLAGNQKSMWQIEELYPLRVRGITKDLKLNSRSRVYGINKRYQEILEIIGKTDFTKMQQEHEDAKAKLAEEKELKKAEKELLND